MRNDWIVVTLAFALFCTPAWVSAATAEPDRKNSIGMEFTRIPAGSFRIREARDGTPGKGLSTREAAIEKSFFLGTHEVTQAQWNALMGNNPSEFSGDTRPVENVSWNDTQEFIRKLNALEKTDKYRLPTDAEWEYAARGGTKTLYFFGEDAASVVFYAWYNFNSGGTSHPVGMKKANAFGLHDIQGNVSEWVQDLHGPHGNARPSAENADGTGRGGRRGVRGCSWKHSATLCRSTQTFALDPEERHGFLGFRVVRDED